LENDPAHPLIVWGFHPPLPSRLRVLFKLMHGGINSDLMNAPVPSRAAFGSATSE
jgi:hypothetical protein